MDLKQLQYFVVSVDCGSFKKAAEVLYTSQPHISKTVKSLETELQMELLKRKSRGVEVTETGKKVYEYACRILLESGKILCIQEQQHIRELKVASLPSSRVADLLGRLYEQENQTGLRIQYMEYSMEEVLQTVHRHAAEIGFVCADVRQMTAFSQIVENRHLEYTELGNTEALLFVGPKSPYYHASSVTNREMKELFYVQTGDDQVYLSLRLLPGEKDYQYYQQRGRILVTNSQYLTERLILETELASIGNGLFFRPSENTEIHKIPICGRGGMLSYGYVKRRQGDLSPEALLAIQFAEKYFSC